MHACRLEVAERGVGLTRVVDAGDDDGGGAVLEQVDTLRESRGLLQQVVDRPREQ